MLKTKQKSAYLASSLASLSLLVSGVSAQAVTLNWSFNATGNRSTSAQLGTVSGTISGVNDNATTSSGLTATVLSTPDHQYEGLTFPAVFSGSIQVTNGVVTNSDLIFQSDNRPNSNNDYLYLGLNGVYPDYQIDYQIVPNNTVTYELYNDSYPYAPPTGGITFGSVPEPLNIMGALVALGLGTLLKRKL